MVGLIRCCLVFLVGSWLLPASASAQLVEQFFHDHNGSLMKVVRERRRVSIFYERPRAVLEKHGVQKGTMLFRGRLDETAYLEGDAKIFSKPCGAISYYVYGQYHEADDFKLVGAAPVLEGCRIVDNRHDIANASLLFRFKRPVGQSSSLGRAGEDTGTNFKRYCLHNVRTSLNMRVGPGRDYGVLAEIPAGDCSVQAQNQKDGDWLGVEWDGHLGWVSSRYLKRAH